MDLTDTLSKPSSDRIISHNLHLLNDSYDDHETGSFPSEQPPLDTDNSPIGRNGLYQGDSINTRSAMEMNDNMGGESPGKAQSNTDTGYPDQFKDSLDDNERPVSNSSAVSRGMDDSPVDVNPEASQDSLAAEKHYQDDLKERVRQSFKDLGMEPEGVLKDDPKEQGKRGKRKKKQQGSERQAGPGSSARDGRSESLDSSEDGQENEPSNYADEPAGDAGEPAGYTDEPAGYADEPAGYADEPGGYADEPAGYADKPAGYADEPAGYTDEPAGYADEPAGYTNQPASYANEQDGYGNQYTGEADEPRRVSNEPVVNASPDPEDRYPDQVTPKGYPSDRVGGIEDPTEGYPEGGDDPEDQTPRGYSGNPDPNREYPEEQGDEYPANDVPPVRHPEENEHQGYNPEPFSDQDHYGHVPSTKGNSDAYPIGDAGINTAGSDQVDDNYPERNSYPEGGSYPNEGGYEDNGGYPEDSGYPDEDTYPNEESYPQEGGYPERSAHGGDSPQDNADPSDAEARNYPKENTPVAPPSYPSRYDNNGYAADDDEEYDDRNQTQGRPKDGEPYDQTPRDSLDYAQPAAVANDIPTEHLREYDDQDNTARNDNPNHEEAPENNPQDSLEYGYPDPLHEQPHQNETSRDRDNHDDRYNNRSFKDPAPYDSLEEDEPDNAPNKTPPQEIPRVPDGVPPKHDHQPGEIWPGDQPSALAVTQLQRDAAEQNRYSSNNSSANSSTDIPQGSSAESRKPSGSQGSPSAQGSAGLQGLPPHGRQKTPSRTRSRGLGSRGYSDLARQRGSANQNGSAGSDKSNDGRPREQNSQRQTGSGKEKNRHSSRLSGRQNRSRSLSNRIKTSPIPANELSAKELLKRPRAKSDNVEERPKVEHSNSQVIRKNGEEVRVAYISDDSGDEDEYFLDEKGSPVDHSGKPLFKDLHGGRKKPEEPKFEFRIKPTPPKQKSPLELQTVNARRTSAEDLSARKAPHGGKITIAKPFPVEEPITEKTTAIQTGTLDDALPPPPNIQEEPIVHKTSAQQEGLNESTLPPPLQDRGTQKEETDSPSGSASNSRTPFGEVRLRSVGTIMSGKSMGRTKPVPEAKKEDPYKDLRFERDAAEEHGRENQTTVEQAIKRDLEAEGQKSAETNTPPQRKPLSGTYNKNDFQKPPDHPANSRGASRSSYQDRAIQYTPQEGQARKPQSFPGPQDGQNPVVQQPYNQQQQGYPGQQHDGYDGQQQEYHPNNSGQSAYHPQPGPHQPSQYHQDGHPTQQNWEQQPPGAPWANAYPSQAPQQFYNTGQPVPVQYDTQQGGPNPQEGYYNPGYDAPMGRPPFQQQDQGQYYEQQQLYDAGYQSYPSAPTQPAGPQGYPNPSQGIIQPPNRAYPNQGVQPAPGYYPNQDQPMQNEPPRQRAPPKPKPNFIDMNKANLARGPPRRKYGEMQKKVPTPTRINPKKPLPDISRESSQYEDPFAENMHNPGSAHTWAHEDWTRQLVQEQQNLPLRRGHSDTNLYVQQAQSGPAPQGYHQQVPLVPSVPGYSNELGYSQDPAAFQPAYIQTYPPQTRRNHNGQPYSYSADHATQFARNNGLTRPQISGPPRARVAFADDYHNSLDSDVNPMVYANEGTNSGYQLATKRTSPYHILPDIPGHPRTEDTSPLRKSDPDSYTARLLKQKQPPQYKEYTLKDYRNLKNDIRLGGLGPDSDLMVEKQEKVNRQRDYAKTVMQQNKKQLQQTKRLWPKNAVIPQEDKPSKRDVGIEYSKKVPKPRMPTPPEVLHERLYGAPSRQQAQEEAEHQERAASEMACLEELKARHEREKQEVDRLRTDGQT